MKINILIVCIFSFAACSTTIKPSYKTEVMRDPDFLFDEYKAVTIYNSSDANFIELKIAALFRSLQFEVLGENESVLRADPVLGVRYTMEPSYDARGLVAGLSMTLLLEDIQTGKTLLTLRGISSRQGPIRDSVFPTEGALWEELQKRLAKEAGMRKNQMRQLPKQMQEPAAKPDRIDRY